MRNNLTNQSLQATIRTIKIRGYFDYVENFIPDDPCHFEIILEVVVGIEGDNREGIERFDVYVCTPSMIVEELKVDDPLMGHAKLIVQRYSYDKIVKYIELYIKMCNGKNIEDVMRRVGLLGEWESEWHK